MVKLRLKCSFIVSVVKNRQLFESAIHHHTKDGNKDFIIINIAFSIESWNLVDGAKWATQ